MAVTYKTKQAEDILSWYQVHVCEDGSEWIKFDQVCDKIRMIGSYHKKFS